MRNLLFVFVGLTLVPSCVDLDERERTDDVVPDAALGWDSAALTDTHRPDIPLPPDFGDPCHENRDCSTGYCIESTRGFVCTRTCDESCPSGWGCKGITSGSSDVRFVCVPNATPSEDTRDSADTTSSDATTHNDTGPEPPLGEACTTPPGAPGDNLRPEGSTPSTVSDWPDCITGCAFQADPRRLLFDLRTDTFNGFSGQIDNRSHTYGFGNGLAPGPDIDIIPLVAAPRTLLEFAVDKTRSADLIDPLIYIHDGFGVRTYNSDASASNLCAQTTFAFPYASGLPIYVVIEDATNYERWTPTGYEGATVGGPDYSWSLRIRQHRFTPIEIGNISPGQVKSLTQGHLALAGETRYYRFYAPGTAHPRVSLKRTGGATFAPIVAGMKTIGGAAEWYTVAEDTVNNTQITLNSTGMRPCIPTAECSGGVTCQEALCSNADAEWIFAVADVNGAAGPGLFTYDLSVEVQP